MSNSDEEIRRTESLLRQVTSSELRLLVTDLSLANTFLLRARTSRDEAARLEQHFANFAATEKNSPRAQQGGEARYLLGLIDEHRGHAAQAKALF